MVLNVINKLTFAFIGSLLFGLNAFGSSYDREINSILFAGPGLNSPELKECKLFPQTDLNSDLHLNLFPSSGKGNLPLAIFISGDGGWGSFDQKVCEKLAEKGMPVVGLDAKKYFWNEKKPKETADEIANLVKQYMKEWNKNTFVLVGYSFGAGVAPFIANNFSDYFKEALKGLYCISPDKTTDFEIHISDMLSIKTNEKYDVIIEMKKMVSLKPVCIFGTEEDYELLKLFTVTGIRVKTLPGGHHYSNDYDALAGIILTDF